MANGGIALTAQLTAGGSDALRRAETRTGLKSGLALRERQDKTGKNAVPLSPKPQVAGAIPVPPAPIFPEFKPDFPARCQTISFHWSQSPPSQMLSGMAGGTRYGKLYQKQTRWLSRTLSVQIPTSMWWQIRLSVRFSRNDVLTRCGACRRSFNRVNKRKSLPRLNQKVRK